MNFRIRVSSDNSTVFCYGKPVVCNPNIFIIVSTEIVIKINNLFLVITDLVELE